LQLFTDYAVPPDGVQDIAKYTIPFALSKKQSDHQPQFIKILRQTKRLEKLHPDFARILILVNQPGLNKLSFKMTRLNGVIIYQFFRAVHTESK
jgi:hypothetical protein